MSSALVRQALEFVDQEESSGKGDKRRIKRQRLSGQDLKNPYSKRRPKKIVTEVKTQNTEETIKKLLALSKPTAKKETAEKIVKRAIKGKPLIEIIEEKRDEGKSILFADEEPDLQTNTEEETS